MDKKIKNIYDIEINNLNKTKKIKFSDFKDKLILIVNTASKCGLTKQYIDLENLHKKYKNSGLVVIGCPCSQFNNQEFENSDDIKNQCLINYGVSFTITEKIDVNGENSHELFKLLKSKKRNLFFGRKIMWNFTKFLINRNGEIVKRFEPLTREKKIEKYIKKYL